ncbi:hypothetical protein [Cohnella sp. GCM10012308]|uniref:hypothetical protein n=1 Tax=Cohnella sp. GCM10012308 TaxID=3317329 RepID=UPI00361C6C7F
MPAFLRQFALLILAGCILFAGFVACIIALISGIHNRDYLALNEKTTVQLKPGKYQIYYEYTETTREMGPLTITQNDKVVALPDLVTAMADDGRASLELAEDRSSTYTFNRKKGESMYRFTVKEKGTYGITLISNVPDLRKYARFTIMGDMGQGFVTLLKKLGLSVAAAIPFLIAGYIAYARIEKRKLAETRLRIQRWPAGASSHHEQDYEGLADRPDSYPNR